MKANFCATKKAGKKTNPAKQSLAQLSKILDKLEKTLKKASHKSKKHCRDDSNSDSKWEIGLGSTRKLGLNLEKAIKWSKFTPPSLIKATPSELATNSNVVSNQKIINNQDIACPVILSNPATLPNSTRLRDPARPSNPATFNNPSTLSNVADIMLISPSRSKGLHNNISTPTASYPPEGKTTAVIAVMRGSPKDGNSCLHSNKHCKQRMVQVLLDSGSDSDLIFVNKDKPMLLPYSKRLVPQLWNTSNGIFQMRHKPDGAELLQIF